MLNKSKDGIVCDLCKIEVKSQFTYYSMDFRKVNVVNHKPEIRSILLERIIKSIDCCENCGEEIKNRLIKNFKPTQSIYCELSGKDLNGTYVLYYCMVDMVVMSNVRYIDKRHIEFNLCEDEFNQFNQLSNKKIESEWTSN
jgi:hypothetical protein